MSLDEVAEQERLDSITSRVLLRLVAIEAQMLDHTHNAQDQVETARRAVKTTAVDRWWAKLGVAGHPLVWTGQAFVCPACRQSRGPRV